MPRGDQVCWTLSKTAVDYRRAPIYKMGKSPGVGPILPVDTILCRGLSHKCQASVLILCFESKSSLIYIEEHLTFCVYINPPNSIIKEKYQKIQFPSSLILLFGILQEL